MSSISFPYRRDTTIEPYSFVITGSGQALQPTAIDKVELAEKGVETFRIVNPAKCWIWLRGFRTADGYTAYTDIAEKGHLFPPGAVEIMKSQFPDFIAVVAADMPSVPAITGGKAWIMYGGGF